jgi:hypothetical protein
MWYHPSYVEGIGRRIAVQACLGKNHETLPGKKKKVKMSGGMAQLPSKCEAMNSTPVLPKKKIKWNNKSDSP